MIGSECETCTRRGTKYVTAKESDNNATKIELETEVARSARPRAIGNENGGVSPLPAA